MDGELIQVKVKRAASDYAMVEIWLGDDGLSILLEQDGGFYIDRLERNGSVTGHYGVTHGNVKAERGSIA